MTHHSKHITLIPHGGLANRMKAIAAGLRLAEAVDSQLHIIWFANKDLNAKFCDLFLPIDSSRVTVTEGSKWTGLSLGRPRLGNVWVPAAYRMINHSRFMNVKTVTRHMDEGDFDFTAWARGHNVWLATCVYFWGEPIPDDAFDIFHPQADLQREIDRMAAQIDADTIGMHIRGTDNGPSQLLSPPEAFAEYLHTLPQHVRVYLATDEASVKSDFKKEFGSRIVSMDHKVCRDTLDGMRDAVVEMFLLARTSRIVGSGKSTFSATPASIGRIPFQTVTEARIASMHPAGHKHSDTLAIIVTYNAMPWLSKCIGSVLQSAVPADIMVIDNKSTDDTEVTVRRDYPQVMFLENYANLGFGQANNIGMNYALQHGYRAVLLLNQDAWIDPDVIGRMADALQRHPDLGIVSPIHLTGRGDKVEHGFSVYSGVTNLRQQPSDDVVTVPFIDAAIWYMPVSVFSHVGLFAPLFYHYGEDKDLANRMRYHHYRIGLVPGVYGYHDREGRRVTWDGFMRAEEVYHLSEYANINYSRQRAIAMGLLAVAKKALLSALRLRLSACCDYIKLLWTLHKKSDKVMITRKQSAHVDLNNYR